MDETPRPRPPRKGAGPRRLADLAVDAAGPALRRRGFQEPAVIRRWPEIVGAALAAHTLPERLARHRPRDPEIPAEGVLHVRVASGALATELQHLAPVMVERINRFFGFKAVDSIRIHQGPLPPRSAAPARPTRSVAPDRAAAIDAATDAVAAPELRDALRRLGRALAAEDKGKG